VVSVGFARSVLTILILTNRGSSRQICLYEISKDTPTQKIVLDMSPSPLIPYYDDDTKFHRHEL
jgi:hypothetical protein